MKRPASAEALGRGRARGRENDKRAQKRIARAQQKGLTQVARGLEHFEDLLDETMTEETVEQVLLPTRASSADRSAMAARAGDNERDRQRRMYEKRQWNRRRNSARRGESVVYEGRQIEPHHYLALCGLNSNGEPESNAEALAAATWATGLNPIPMPQTNTRQGNWNCFECGDECDRDSVHNTMVLHPGLYPARYWCRNPQCAVETYERWGLYEAGTMPEQTPHGFHRDRCAVCSNPLFRNRDLSTWDMERDLNPQCLDVSHIPDPKYFCSFTCKGLWRLRHYPQSLG